MTRRCIATRLWTFVTVFALSFAQLAMAAFAPPAATPAMVAAMAEEGGCHEDDPATRHLCIKKNCQDDAQKHDVSSCAALPPSTEGGLRVETVEPGMPPSARRARDPGLARATSPPPTLLFAHFLK